MFGLFNPRSTNGKHESVTPADLESVRTLQTQQSEEVFEEIASLRTANSLLDEKLTDLNGKIESLEGTINSLKEVSEATAAFKRFWDDISASWQEQSSAIGDIDFDISDYDDEPQQREFEHSPVNHVVTVPGHFPIPDYIYAGATVHRAVIPAQYRSLLPETGDQFRVASVEGRTVTFSVTG